MPTSSPYDQIAEVPAFEVTSTDVTDGGTLPTPQVSGIFGAGGEDVSPQLSWTGFPLRDEEFRHHRVRPHGTDRKRILALGRHGCSRFDDVGPERSRRARTARACPKEPSSCGMMRASPATSGGSSRGSRRPHVLHRDPRARRRNPRHRGGCHTGIPRVQHVGAHDRPGSDHRYVRSRVGPWARPSAPPARGADGRATNPMFCPE
jgi:hypothetical protein